MTSSDRRAETRPSRTTAFLVLFVLALAGPGLLGCDDEEEGAEQDTGPIVGIMEMPISWRNTASAPSNAVQIEISPTEYRVDHQKVLDLDRGFAPDGEKSNGELSAVSSAVSSGAARRAAVITLHVNTPYETLAYTMGSLKAANISQVAFQVRKPGGSADTGYLVLDQYRVEEATDEPVSFEGPAQKEWADMVAAWEEAYTGCRRNHYVDCTPSPVVAAEGGDLELRFFARGSALKAEFRQFGVEEEEGEAPAPQMLEGIAPPPPPQGEEEEIPPVDHGAFTWRFEAATDELSPISSAFRPLCGQAPCGIVVTGDPDTMSMRLISMLGAAFPDGAPAPYVVFHLPG